MQRFPVHIFSEDGDLLAHGIENASAESFVYPRLFLRETDRDVAWDELNAGRGEGLFAGCTCGGAWEDVHIRPDVGPAWRGVACMRCMAIVDGCERPDGSDFGDGSVEGVTPIQARLLPAVGGRAGRKLLTVDHYCGAGGFSLSLKLAAESLGVELESVAINHWQTAIETHSRNLTEVRHYCQDLEQVDPHEAVPGGYLDQLIASPSCVFFSQARGARPINDQLRAGPWEVVKWCRELHVRSVIVENVPEIIRWSPLCTMPEGHRGRHRETGIEIPGLRPRTRPSAYDPNVVDGVRLCCRPIPEKRGRIFDDWLGAFREMGYDVEYRVLNAADYGAATSRKRFFLIARCDGMPIRFPAPTHSRTGADGKQKWVPSAAILDLEDRGMSIFEREQHGRPPLTVNTKLRMARGIQRYYGSLARYFIPLLDITKEIEELAMTPEQRRQRAVSLASLPARHGRRLAITWEHLRDELHLLLNPEKSGKAPTRVAAQEAFAQLRPLSGSPRDEDKLRALLVTAYQEIAVRKLDAARAEEARLLEACTEDPAIQPFTFGNRTHNVAVSAATPIPTATTAMGGGIALVQASLASLVFGQHGGSVARNALTSPIPTVATDGALSLMQPLLYSYYGRDGVIHTAARPLHTLRTENTFGLLQPTLIHYFGQSSASSTALPVPALTTRDRYGFLSADLSEATAAMLVKLYGTSSVSGIDAPVPTITAGGQHIAMLQPTILSYFGRSACQPVSDPVPTLMGQPHHYLLSAGIVGSGLVASCGGPSADARPLTEPLQTVLTKDRLGLLGLGVEPFLLSRNNAFTGSRHARAFSMGRPLPTITTCGGGYVLWPDMLPFLVPNFGERDGQAPRCQSVANSLPTVTSHGAGGLVTSLVVQIDQSGRAGRGVRPVSESLATLVAKANLSLVSPLMLQMGQVGRSDAGTAVAVDAAPMPTVTGRKNLALAGGSAVRLGSNVWLPCSVDMAQLLGMDPRRLVWLNGELHVLDLFFRMLKVRELAAAMGFIRPDFGEYEFVGTQGDVTQQIGNAVETHVGEALLKVQLEDTLIALEREAEAVAA